MELTFNSIRFTSYREEITGDCFFWTIKDKNQNRPQWFEKKNNKRKPEEPIEIVESFNESQALDQKVLLGFTVFFWVLLCFAVFYCVLLCFTVFYWVLLGFTGFYWVSLSLNGFYWARLEIIRLSWALSLAVSLEPTRSRKSSLLLVSSGLDRFERVSPVGEKYFLSILRIIMIVSDPNPAPLSRPFLFFFL